MSVAVYPPLTRLLLHIRDPSYQCTATTPEAVQEAVWQQRRLEFVGEGMAYFDIMRLNKGVNRFRLRLPGYCRI